MVSNEFSTVVSECTKEWKKRFFDSEIFCYKPSDTYLKTVYREWLLYGLDVLKKLKFS